MSKRDGMYSSNKRKKELQRQKKQEEKKQKRLKKADIPVEGTEEAASMDPEQEVSESTTEETD